MPTASGLSDVVDISDLDGDPLDEVDDFLDLVSQSDDESEFADGYKLGQMVDTGTVPPFGISSLPRKPALHPLHSWYRGFSQGKFASLVLVELFGGILSTSEACRQLGLSIAQCYYSETDPDAILVNQVNWPTAINLGDIEKIDEDVVCGIYTSHPDSLILITGGPPCQDVSALEGNADGAMGA